MLDITLSLIVLVIALIQLLRDKPEDEEKVFFNRFSWTTVLMILLILSSIIGIVKSILDNQDSTKLQANVSSIVSGVDDLDSLISKSIKSIDSSASTISNLTNRVDSVKIKTEAAISNWNKSLSTSDDLTLLLERKLKSEKEILLASAPKMTCLTSDLKFVKLDSNQSKFLLVYRNFGGRTASNVKLITNIVFLDSSFNKLYSSRDESYSESIFPHNEGNHFKYREWKSNKFTDLFIDSKIRWAYISVQFSYEDPVIIGPKLLSSNEYIFTTREKKKIKFYDYDSTDKLHLLIRKLSYQ